MLEMPVSTITLPVLTDIVNGFRCGLDTTKATCCQASPLRGRIASPGPRVSCRQSSAAEQMAPSTASVGSVFSLVAMASRGLFCLLDKRDAYPTVGQSGRLSYEAEKKWDVEPPSETMGIRTGTPHRGHRPT